MAFFAGEYSRAEASYLRALDNSPAFMQRLRHSIGHLYYLTGRFAEARHMYDGMSDTVAWNYSFRLATLGQLGLEAELDHDRQYFVTAFDSEQRRFALHLYTFADAGAVPLLIEGYKKAGILDEVGLNNLSMPLRKAAS